MINLVLYINFVRSIFGLYYILLRVVRKTPKEWQPLKTYKNCVQNGRKATHYFPTCQLNEFARINVEQNLLFHTADGANNYIAEKKRLRKRGGKKQTNVSGAVLSICFPKKWITPYLIKVNKGSWNFCWCDTRTKNKILLKNNINFNKKPRVLKKT